jgi:hypothetical protein
MRVLECPTHFIELVEEVSEEVDARLRWWIENHPCVNSLHHLPSHELPLTER